MYGVDIILILGNFDEVLKVVWEIVKIEVVVLVNLVNFYCLEG